MRRYVFLCLLLALAACQTREQQLSVYRARCFDYGFFAGTKDFAKCMENQEYHDQKLSIERRRVDALHDHSFGVKKVKLKDKDYGRNGKNANKIKIENNVYNKKTPVFNNVHNNVQNNIFVEREARPQPSVNTPRSTPIVEEFDDTPAAAPHVASPIVEEFDDTPAAAPHVASPIVEEFNDTPAAAPHVASPIVEEFNDTPAAAPHVASPIVQEMSESPVSLETNDPLGLDSALLD